MSISLPHHLGKNRWRLQIMGKINDYSMDEHPRFRYDMHHFSVTQGMSAMAVCLNEAHISLK
jgi:hypothetical protein